MKEHEIMIVRDLAKKFKEIAVSNEMEERRRLWRCIKDLKMERPMIHFEIDFTDDYLLETELECENQFLRYVERTLKGNIKHFYEVGDDVVLEPYFRLAWNLNSCQLADKRCEYGIELKMTHGIDNQGGHLGYTYDFPIHNPEDIKKLVKREFYPNLDSNLESKKILEDIFGDILEIKLENYDNFFESTGYTPFVGNYFIGITMDMYKYLGNNNLLYWIYDNPDALREFAQFLTEDRIRFFNWLEEQKMIAPNSDNQFAGPGSYGYTTQLKQVNSKGDTKLSDLWVWAESQETHMISPEQFKNLFLPYIAEVCKKFGFVYYGCCETIEDRFEIVKKAIPNIRAVSVSGWNNFIKVGEILGKDYVYSRKPTPAYLSTSSLDWDLAKKDMELTYQGMKKGNCNTEIIFRDVYNISGDHTRISKWVAMTKSIFGI